LLGDWPPAWRLKIQPGEAGGLLVPQIIPILFGSCYSSFSARAASLELQKITIQGALVLYVLNNREKLADFYELKSSQLCFDCTIVTIDFSFRRVSL
jgi:hypothetical protein